MQKTNGRGSKIAHFEMTSFVDVPKSKFSLILDIYVLVYEIVVTCPSINYEYLYYVTHTSYSKTIQHICFEKTKTLN